MSIFNLTNIERVELNDNTSIKVELASYMMDRKATDYYFGAGGAYCDLCTFS